MMTFFPPEEEKKTVEEDAWEMQRSGRREGFLTGFLAAIAAVWLLSSVPKLAARFLESGSGEQGAAVLTSEETLAKLAEVQHLIEENYLGDVDSDELSAYLFRGIAVGLQDLYASYYTEQELNTVMESSRGEYFGIGATIRKDARTGEFSVAAVYEGSPAQESGLQEEDVILAVNDQEVQELDLNSLVAEIRSQEGTFLLKIYRPASQEELELSLACSDVSPDYVEYEMLENQIGYIRIAEFTTSAVEQFRDAAANLQGEGMEKLIVDLRDNPGGLLDAVCEILDEILPEGLMVYTETKDGSREEYRSDDERSIVCEIAVLVNGSSASASEIFAGAVQDYELGPVIGTQTYGKGVVQKTYTLSDGSALKLTVEKYFTPKGRDIDGSGIMPDFVVEDAEAEASEDGADEGTASGQEADQAEPSGADAETEADQTETSGAGADTEANQAEDRVLAKAIEVLSE